MQSLTAPSSHQDYQNLVIQCRAGGRESESSQQKLSSFASLIDIINGELNIKHLRQKVLACFKRLVGKRADVMAFYFVRNKDFDSVYSKMFLTRVLKLGEDSNDDSPDERHQDEENSPMNHLEYFDRMLNEQVPQHYKAILSFVVKTGQNVYIRDATNFKSCEHFPMQKEEIDQMSVKSIMVLALRDRNQVTQAVIKLKSFKKAAFDNLDSNYLNKLSVHCGDAISNALVYSLLCFENECRRSLLSFTPSLFDTSKSLDDLLYQMMKQTQRLFNSTRCTIFIPDVDVYSKKLVQTITCTQAANMTNEDTDIEDDERLSMSRVGRLEKVYDLEPTKEYKIVDYENFDCILKELAQKVYSTGEKVNIRDADLDPAFQKAALSAKESRCICYKTNTKSIMCVPLLDPQNSIIGCVRISRSTDIGSNFDSHDENLLEEFCKLYSVSISQKLQRKEYERAQVEKKVKEEILAYHMKTDKTSEKECCENKLAQEILKNEFETKNPTYSTIFQLSELGRYDFDFNNLNDDEMVYATFKIFRVMDLIKLFEIEEKTLVNWILSVRYNYRCVQYHNWRHGFNCFRNMFAIFQNSKIVNFMDKVDILSLLVGCLCHDLDHRGKGNQHQQETNSLLFQLYGKNSTMKQHHFACFLQTLTLPENNIFEHLEPELFGEVAEKIRTAILSTDLIEFFKVQEEFERVVAGKRAACMNWSEEENKQLLWKYLLSYCDFGATMSKSWGYHLHEVSLILKENVDTYQIKGPNMAKYPIRWIDELGLPVLSGLALICDSFKPLVCRVKENRKRWTIMNHLSS